MANAIAWLQANGAMVFGVLFAISEALDMIPQIQASSVWKAVWGAMKWIKAKFFAPKV